MSDETTVKEPLRTAAAKRLLEASQDEYEWAAFEPPAVLPTLAAIENEARSTVLADVRAAVEGLPTVFIKVSGGGKASVVARAAVLALIDHISEGK